MTFIPHARPKATLAIVLSVASESWERSKIRDPLPAFFVFAVRGYYQDTMGVVGQNDIGIYDDAIFIIGPDTFKCFNANTDPSRNLKGMATLLPGWYPFRPGNHGISRPGGGYPAFRPATPGEALPVRRHGYDMVPHPRAGIAINIHRGGELTTSSEGCQTIPPHQWTQFQTLVALLLRQNDAKTFWYGLHAGAIA